jgi:RND family efflux transporter MFP subunit
VTLQQYAQIKAPYDGIITARHVDTKHAVQPSGGNGQPLLVIASRGKVRVMTSIPETEAPLVSDAAAGADPVVVAVQAIPNRTWEGTVTRTSWSLDAANRSLTVEIDLANDDDALRPGMYATAQVRLAEAKDVLTVPAAAIVREGSATLCCVVAGATVSRRPVQLGLRVGDEIEVQSGLTETDAIVLARAGGLKEGQPVEVLPPPAK